ncbi:MAG: bifunctional 5,10-methylenetetrahydrofolate dehydrogenase/5,10-methenyltetrahydrofolate cyclohydrolase [Thermoplasmata archaeon]|nr:bifunctional 5,10-methylenetetrahydrofolate dehydrogenase/5,10-methenyltetrahydrofolate cyclohydrolase [Thermoplasmata archaeon]
MVKVVDGKVIAGEIKQRVKENISELMKKGYEEPCVATVKVGENKESNLFLNLKDKACVEVGVKPLRVEFPLDSSVDEIVGEINKLNSDEGVHGVVVQFPLPKHVSMHRVISSINQAKDVEGLTPYNLGNLVMGEERTIPCTPLAVLKILEHENVKLEGANVVIVNHSPVVGKPLDVLLLNRDATVTVCHVYTKDLKRHTKNADVLVVAAGVPGLITSEHVKEGATVIDVGITKTSNGVKGDVVFDEVKKVAGIITPVPGGVGPVTVACFLENMLKIYRNCVEEK